MEKRESKVEETEMEDRLFGIHLVHVLQSNEHQMTFGILKKMMTTTD